jgi:large subunit ribosomal protein L1
MRSKAYKAVKEKVPATAVSLTAAVQFIKDNARKTFDETIEVHVRLGIDASKSDQMVRGTVSLPSGAAKQKRIAVFAAGAAEQKAALAAGAVIAGGEELIAKVVETGKLDADIAVATPDMMPKIAKVARVLGPQGLMPNPKTGTVVAKPAEAVAALQGGKISFKMDQLGNLHESVGKASWEAEKIVANVRAFMEAVQAARPATAKGQFLRRVVLKSAMGPAIPVTAA